MKILAFFTTAPLLKPYEDAQNDVYRTLAGKIFDETTRDTGYLGRSGYDDGDIWGDFVIPKLYQDTKYEDLVVQTLSLWQDLESVYAFSYYGSHAQALRRRYDWFEKVPRTDYVGWWIDENHQPTWEEGATLFDQLDEHGSTATAFNFRQPFDANGEVVKIDRDLVQTKAKFYQ